MLRTCSYRDGPIYILEFGCFCGPNLALLAERLADQVPIILSGIEPNKEACNFLREKMPSVRVLNLDDRAFVTNPPHEKVNIAFISAVFYAMNEKSTFMTIEALSKLADTIVIADEIENARGVQTIFSRKTLAFHHPYITWLESLGFETVKSDLPNKVRANNGVVVARKLKGAVSLQNAEIKI